VRDGVAALRVGRDIKRDTTWVVNIPLEEDTVMSGNGEQEKGDDDGNGGEGNAVEQKSYPGASASRLVKFLEGLPREAHAVPRDYHAHGTGRISGPYARPNPREVGGATVELTEGMWEEQRGVKLDGGERRRDKVRFMRKVAKGRAIKEQRDAEELAKRGGG